MTSRQRLLVAALISGAVATEIDGLRRALGSNQLERIPPHVTLVPPTNVTNDELASAEQVVRDGAAGFEPITLSLGPPATFADNPSVLFLSVAAPPSLGPLRAALFRGPFAERTRTDRSFVPHVTLDSRRESFVDDRILRDLGGYVNSVEVASIALLVQDQGTARGRWTTLTSYELAPRSVVGRGGLEVHLHAGRTLSPSSLQLLNAWTPEVAEPGGADGDESFALATLSSTPVAIASWSVDGDVAVLRRHVVSPQWRGVGVGTTLLSFVEAHERARGRRAIVVGSDPASAGEGYYLGRGYRRDVRVARRGAGEEPLTRLF